MDFGILVQRQSPARRRILDKSVKLFTTTIKHTHDEKDVSLMDNGEVWIHSESDDESKARISPRLSLGPDDFPLFSPNSFTHRRHDRI